MLASIRNRVQALKFDLLLTKDLVPVLSHEPWSNEQLQQASQRFANRVGPEVARVFVLAATVVVSHGMTGGVA